jgi:hypothetical protein
MDDQQVDKQNASETTHGPSGRFPPRNIRIRGEGSKRPPLARWLFRFGFLVFLLLMPAGVALTGIPRSTPYGHAPAGIPPDYLLIIRVLAGMLLFLVGWLFSVILAVVGVVRAGVVRRKLPGWTVTALVYMVVGLLVILWAASR